MANTDRGIVMLSTVAGIFWTGRVVSLVVYVSTWFAHNGYIASQLGGAERVNALHHRLKHSDMLLATFARDQPQWWPLHVLLVVALCGGAPHGGWRPDLWGLRAVACTHCALMCCGKALLRIGHVDLGNFFTRDRALCVALCVGGWASPALLYVAVVHACLLTYTVGSSAGLAQPYSNYLGFEYCRWVTCSCLASMAVVGVMGSLSAHGYVEGELGAEPALLSVLASVASYYFAQGAGKLRLGSHWLQWPLHNRIECLWVNACLRGHLAQTLSLDSVVVVAQVLRSLRVPLNCGGLVAELFAIATVTGVQCAVAGALLRCAFHVGVVAMSGLFDWEAILGNAFLAAVLVEGGFDAAFALPWSSAATAGVCVVLSDQWALWVASIPDIATKIALFDAADLPMCWWDSNYMRMYEWSVETAACPGVEKSFPVHLFSPYDTLITDIHTRLMYLQLYPGLDRTKSADRRVVKSGVWGLLLDRNDADFVHGLADAGATHEDLCSQFCPMSLREAWRVGGGDESDDMGDHVDAECAVLADLVRFFHGWNAHTTEPWFRAVGSALCGYHWPGEDLVPDISPLRSPRRPVYVPADGPIAVVHVRRIKSWFTGERVLLLEDALVGTIRLDGPKSRRTRFQDSSEVEPRRISSRDIGVLCTSSET